MDDRDMGVLEFVGFGIFVIGILLLASWLWVWGIHATCKVNPLPLPPYCDAFKKREVNND